MSAGQTKSIGAPGLRNAYIVGGSPCFTIIGPVPWSGIQVEPPTHNPTLIQITTNPTPTPGATNHV